LDIATYLSLNKLLAGEVLPDMTLTNTRGAELRKLTLLLYYPAVLGAGLLFVVTKWAEIGSIRKILSNSENYMALWLIGFFSVSYLVTDTTSEEKYNWWAFICDIGEMAAMFICFYFLGFVFRERLLNFRIFYYVLACLPLLQGLWILAVGRRREILVYPSIIMTILLLGAAQWSSYSFVNVITVGTLFGLLIYYYLTRFPG
jgi:hypothetical protein